MDEIMKLTGDINNCKSINEKIQMVQLLNELIAKEKKILHDLQNNNINTMKVKIPLKYKKLSIEELENMFNNSIDIHEKIILYHAINRIVTNIGDELFETE